MNLADIHFSDHDRVAVARLTGEIDLSNAGSIESAITESTPNRALALILDVSALDYLDSAGIHLIYRLREKLRARGQSLRLVIPADSPANDALRLAGVSQVVATAQTLEAALEEFAPPDPAPAPEVTDPASAPEVTDHGTV